LSAVHSLGRVPAGELCFAVAASAVRRKAAMEGCQSAVERIKAEVPIVARELLEDGNHVWKRNS
ncbi:MAG: molybdenum cofactor biosynthesis protein MoaE, partial [Spirochaetales bacterium]